MKPAPFTYHRPSTTEEAVALLGGEAGDNGRVIAGGQSLIPMMAYRLANPSHVVDINRIEELGRATVEGGFLRIGALVRHAYFHSVQLPAALGDLLPRIVRTSLMVRSATAVPSAEVWLMPIPHRSGAWSQRL